MEKKTVSLSLSTIIRECSLDPTKNREHLEYFKLQNRENIHEIFRYRKFNEDFTNTLMCYKDEKTTIRPNYDEFLLKLSYLLGCPLRGKVEDNDKLTEVFKKRWEELASCLTEAEVKDKFPLIYKDYLDGLKYLKDIYKLKNEGKVNSEQYKELEHYYYGSGLMPSFKKFHKRQVEQYHRYINDREKLKDLQKTKSYNSYLRQNFNMNKLHMYVMHEYLSKCENSKDRDEIKEYLGEVAKYLMNIKNKNKYEITTDEGIKVNYDNLVLRYENLRKQLLDRSNLVEWVLVPEGRDYSRVSEEHSPRTTLLNIEEIQRLEALGERKRVFYEGTPYVAKVIGLRRYHGYVGYIYSNGEVILDREYNPSNLSSATDNAIYNMKVEDFEDLSKCDKQILRKHPKVSHMNHSRYWEDRVRLIIDQPETVESKEEVNQLIKRLKEKEI